MANIGDENVVLGGHGLAVEFCIFCLALGVRLLGYHLLMTLKKCNVKTLGTHIKVQPVVSLTVLYKLH